MPASDVVAENEHMRPSTRSAARVAELMGSDCGSSKAGSECPLMALSRHFWMARRMSAFVGKADISDTCSNVCL